MQNKVFLIGFLVFVFYCQNNHSFAQTNSYIIDAESSSITFEITHLGILNVSGEFQRFTGKYAINKEGLLCLESTIDVSSIYTGDTRRDNSLIEEAYLDVQHFPHIKFQSVNTIDGSKDMRISGQLRIKNVVKDIIMTYDIFKDQDVQILTLTTTLSRKAFGLDFGPMNSLIGDLIKVSIEIRGKKS